MSEPERFAFWLPIRVHWGEVDRMGHVNNAMFSRYVESARCEYFRQVGILDATSAPVDADLPAPPALPPHVGPILARIEIDFKRPVVQPDTVNVGVATTKIRRSSAIHRYVLTSDRYRGAVVAVAECVWVVFDYRASTPVPMPDALRKRIIDLEATAGRTVAT